MILSSYYMQQMSPAKRPMGFEISYPLLLFGEGRVILVPDFEIQLSHYKVFVSILTQWSDLSIATGLY